MAAGGHERVSVVVRTSWLAVVCPLLSLALLAGNAPVATADTGADQHPQTSQAPETIPVEEFMASPFAEFFRADDYKRALEALEPILERYPNDLLVLRYKAMTLDRLGRSQEAVVIYQELLRRSPDHTPTRFFLGQAYERMGDRDQAAKEWRWVADRSPVTEYRQWAQEGLARVGVAREAVPTRKRWALLGNLGWDWDSNVLLKPDDKALATTGDKNAGRFSIDLGVRYRALAERDVQVDLSYTSRQSLHDDSLDDFNFTSQEFGVDARRRAQLAGREVTLGARYDLLGGFLESDLFSLSNRFTLSADTPLTPHTRTVVSNRFTVSNFGPDGPNPPQTSRDGLYNDLGLTQYWYTDDFRRYLFLRQEYNAAGTRGGNFDRRGLTTRIGAHSPLRWRTDADVSGGLLYNAYPHFTSLSSLDTARRRDTNWDVAASLTHHLTPQVDLRLQYRWVNAVNRNDFFQYNRHVVGMHLLFTQAF